MYCSKEALRQNLGAIKYNWLVFKANVLCFFVVHSLRAGKKFPRLVRDYLDYEERSGHDQTCFYIFFFKYSCCNQMFWSDYYQSIQKSKKGGFDLFDIDKTWMWKKLKPGSLFYDISKAQRVVEL